MRQRGGSKSERGGKREKESELVSYRGERVRANGGEYIFHIVRRVVRFAEILREVRGTPEVRGRSRAYLLARPSVRERGSSSSPKPRHARIARGPAIVLVSSSHQPAPIGASSRRCPTVVSNINGRHAECGSLTACYGCRATAVAAATVHPVRPRYPWFTFGF